MASVAVDRKKKFAKKEDNRLDGVNPVALYTNSTQEGILQGNHRPPICKDLALYKNFTFFANTQSRAGLDLHLIGTDNLRDYTVNATQNVTVGSDLTNQIQMNSTDLEKIAVGDILLIGGSAVFSVARKTSDRVYIASAERSAVSITPTTSIVGLVPIIINSEIYVGYEGATAPSGIPSDYHTYQIPDTGTPHERISQTVANLTGAINEESSSVVSYDTDIDTHLGQIMDLRPLTSSPVFISSSAGSEFAEHTRPAPYTPIGEFLEGGTKIVDSKEQSYIAFNMALGDNTLQGKLSNGKKIRLFHNAFTKLNREFTIQSFDDSLSFGAILITLNQTYEEIGVDSSSVVNDTANYIAGVLDGDPLTISQQTISNRLRWSKDGRPEAAPITNFVDVGSKIHPIKRILPSRDSLIIIKDDGVYKLDGDGGDWQVQLLDSTVQIRGDDTAAVFNNSVFMMSTQGVVQITDTGVTVRSRPIEREILSTVQLPSFNETAFAVTYESERFIVFFVPESSGSKIATKSYVYSSFTRSWTNWTVPAYCGLVGKDDDRLYLGGDNVLLRERKDRETSDYVDLDLLINISGRNGKEVLILNPLGGQSVLGAVLVQGRLRATVIGYDAETKQYILDREQNWTTALGFNSARIFYPIPVRVDFNKVMDEPHYRKQFTEVEFFFEEVDFEKLSTVFRSRYQQVGEENATTLIGSSVWGREQWGDGAWGVGSHGTISLRQWIPRRVQKGDWLSIGLRSATAFTRFILSGYAVKTRLAGTRA